MNVSVRYDTIVIGGGASGLAAALSAARRGDSVCVLERDVACGLKILATGNGRCNLSNIALDPERYSHPEFVAAVMGKDPEQELDGLFSSVGIYTARENDRIYPYSFRAESVRDALLAAVANAGIDIVCGANVTEATKSPGNGWEITFAHPQTSPKLKHRRDHKAELRALRRAFSDAPAVSQTVIANHIVIAVGGSPSELALLFGLPVTPTQPVLCPLKASVPGQTQALTALNGLRVQARVKLVHSGNPLWEEAGEVLFRPYGISGVVVFNLSRRAHVGDKVLLDLFPSLSEDELRGLLSDRACVLGPCTSQDPTWFDGLLAPVLGKVICAELTRSQSAAGNIDTVAKILKAFELEVQGLADDQGAQVTRGGIPVSCVSAPHLACIDPKFQGISVCGEALDIDADCGGFNLAWAWLSGLRAGARL